ncbi:hypothetical protein CFAEC_03955 [Corynebacterium faecale]|nr:hypothetical protein CFAEC_03955 [Corynebacterium faecale]
MLHVSGFLLIGLIVVVWLVVLAPLLLRGQKPIRKAGEAFDETRVILEGGNSVPVRRRPRLAGDAGDEEIDAQDPVDEEYEIVDSPSIFRHRREDVPEERDPDDIPDNTEVEPETTTSHVAADDEATAVVVALVDDQEEVEQDAPVVEVIEEWNAEDHYPMDGSYNTPIDLMHHEERVRATAEYRAAHSGDQDAGNPADAPEDAADYGELTQADMDFAESRRGRGYYDPRADREVAQSKYLRRQRTLLGLGLAVVFTLILGFIFGGGAWFLPVLTVAVTAFYLVALRSQVRAENELRARRIRRLRRSRMGVRNSEDLPSRLRRPGAVVLELDDESPDFEGLSTLDQPIEHNGDDYRSYGARRVS